MNNMFNLKSFFKFLNKNRLYTFIEVFGLSLSLMFVIVIAVYTMQELSTDTFQENKDRLYVVANQESLGMAYRLADKLKDNFPEIEEVCPMVNFYKKMPVELADKKLVADLMFTSSTFFDLFSFEIREGNKDNAFAARNDAVISETFARKAFPDRDPLGQSLQLNDSVYVMVSAVIKDIKNSAIPYADILLRIDNVKYFNPSLDSEEYNNMGSTPVLVLERKGSNLRSKTEEVFDYLKKNVWTYKNGVSTSVSFIPLQEVYFSSVKGYDGLLFKQGDKTFVLILLSIGLLILLFAIINYINLTVAQTGYRAKEMATRKLLGSSRYGLFNRLMLESSLICLIAFFAGVLLASAVTPYVNNLLQTRIDLRGMFSPIPILVSLAIVFLIGGLAGLLPAIIISRAKAIDVVKGSFRKQTKMVLSKIFITFQQMITIALVTTSLVMVFQINHLIKAPLGYNTSNIITLDIEPLGDRQKTAITLGKELEKLAVVKRIAYSAGTPFNGGNNHTKNYGEKNITFQSIIGDSAFFKMYGIQIVKDNQLVGKQGYYLSQQAIKELEIPDDSPTFPFDGIQEPVAGIIKDFQIQNIVFEKRPILFQLKKTADLSYIWDMSVEVEGDPYIAYNKVKDVYEQITGQVFTGEYIDQQIKETFTQQEKTSKIIVLFSFVAILLSFLGLVAMSTYFIQQRSREIALRKVFGSSNPQVLRRLVFTFLNYVVIAFVIVTPLTWFLINQWLSGYTYRISLSPWFFLSAGICCLLISFLTVFWQSLRAANDNPIKNIKTE